MELYDDRDALLRFEEMMQTAWKNREEPLRDLDRAREADPFWYRGAGMPGVTMYTDLFARSLRGGMEKLSYLRELGGYLSASDAAAENAASTERRRLCRGRFRYAQSKGNIAQ